MSVPPPDEEPRGLLVASGCFVWLGLSYLVPFHAVLLCVDHFAEAYPLWKAPFAFSLLYFLPNVLCMALVVVYGSRFSLNSKALVGYLGFVAVLLLFAMMLLFFPSYPVFVVLALLVGTFDAVAQTSVVGFAASLPLLQDRGSGRWLRLVLAGNAVAGVAVSALKVGIKAAHDDTRTASVLFLLVSAALMLLTAGVLLLLPRLPVVALSLQHQAPPHPLPVATVLHTSRLQLLLIAFTFFLTLSLYPGLAASFPSRHFFPATWGGIVALTAFNVGDLAGRLLVLPRPQPLRDWPNVGLCCARALFVPLLLTAKVYRWDVLVAAPLLFLLGLTGGYVGTLNASAVPLLFGSPDAKEAAGVVVSFAILVGLAMGSLLSYAVSVLVG